MGEEPQFVLGLRKGSYVTRHTDPHTVLPGPADGPQNVHDSTIFVDIPVTEVDVGLTIDDPGNGDSCDRQVVGIHIVGDQGADQSIGTITK